MARKWEVELIYRNVQYGSVTIDLDDPKNYQNKQATWRTLVAQNDNNNRVPLNSLVDVRFISRVTNGGSLQYFHSTLGSHRDKVPGCFDDFPPPRSESQSLFTVPYLETWGGDQVDENTYGCIAGTNTPLVLTGAHTLDPVDGFSDYYKISYKVTLLLQASPACPVACYSEGVQFPQSTINWLVDANGEKYFIENRVPFICGSQKAKLSLELAIRNAILKKVNCDPKFLEIKIRDTYMQPNCAYLEISGSPVIFKTLSTNRGQFSFNTTNCTS